jgi:2'-5' RNA ligase
VRLFVAVDLPGPLRGRVEELLAELRREVPDVRWTRAEGIHLTLKFLGEVEEGRVGEVAGALAGAARRARGGFTVVVAGLGTFGDRGRPRVVWAGVREPTGSLARLHAEVESAAGPLGFPPEGRPFSPHLTLARLKAPSRHLGRALAARAQTEVGAFEVGACCLFQSLLRPSGAEYARLGEFPLGSAGEAA